ncbi:hypothetical protein [Marinobacter sp. HN1S83]|uniref:hypothetical protein n=1 Tax=Marinobacter sp. HN1S83 TaxID=3382301 RepID=UPI00387ACFDB
MNKAQWESYVDVMPDIDSDSPTVKHLLSIIEDEDLVRVIHFHFGTKAINWLDKSVPALNDKTPRGCLQSDAGVEFLRETLMNMPC